jgi:hypothetical protein
MIALFQASSQGQSSSFAGFSHPAVSRCPKMNETKPNHGLDKSTRSIVQFKSLKQRGKKNVAI